MTGSPVARSGHGGYSLQETRGEGVFVSTQYMLTFSAALLLTAVYYDQISFIDVPICPAVCNG